MDSEQANKLIDVLEAFRKRPSLYLGENNVMLATIFLSGFMCAVAQMESLKIRETMVQSRGWRMPKATGPGIEGQMAEKGMTPLEIISELAAIDIDIIREAISK